MRFTFPQSVGLRFEIQPQFVLKGVLTQAFFKKRERKNVSFAFLLRHRFSEVVGKNTDSKMLTVNVVFELELNNLFSWQWLKLNR